MALGYEVPQSRNFKCLVLIFLVSAFSVNFIYIYRIQSRTHGKKIFSFCFLDSLSFLLALIAQWVKNWPADIAVTGSSPP